METLPVELRAQTGDTLRSRLCTRHTHPSSRIFYRSESLISCENIGPREIENRGREGGTIKIRANSRAPTPIGSQVRPDYFHKFTLALWISRARDSRTCLDSPTHPHQHFNLTRTFSNALSNYAMFLIVSQERRACPDPGLMPRCAIHKRSSLLLGLNWLVSTIVRKKKRDWRLN